MFYPDSKPAVSPSAVQNSSTNAETSSSPYNITQLQQMNNGAISGLNYQHQALASYHQTVPRSDSVVKVESPENLTAHAQYAAPSPGKHHSGLENEHLQSLPHSINNMGLSSNEAGAMGTVSVGAS